MALHDQYFCWGHIAKASWREWVTEVLACQQLSWTICPPFCSLVQENFIYILSSQVWGKIWFINRSVIFETFFKKKCIFYYSRKTFCLLQSLIFLKLLVSVWYLVNVIFTQYSGFWKSALFGFNLVQCCAGMSSFDMMVESHFAATRTKVDYPGWLIRIFCRIDYERLVTRANKPSAGVSPVDFSIKPRFAAPKLNCSGWWTNYFCLVHVKRLVARAIKPSAGVLPIDLSIKPLFAPTNSNCFGKKHLKGYLTEHLQEP